jgi:hypothetical protein
MDTSKSTTEFAYKIICTATILTKGTLNSCKNLKRLAKNVKILSSP